MAQVLGILTTPSATAHAVHELKHAGFAELEKHVKGAAKAGKK